jgi:hypothetical protein
MFQDLDKKAKIVTFDQIGLNMVKRFLGQNPISVNIDLRTATALSAALSIPIMESSRFEVVKSGDAVVIAKYHGPDLKTTKDKAMPHNGRFDFYRAVIS